MSSISRRQFVSAMPMVGAGAWLGLCPAARAQECALAGGEAGTLFENVRIFDSRTAGLSAPSHALVEGTAIARISATPIAVDRSVTTVVAGGGRTLIPGLIEAHARAIAARPPGAPLILTSDWNYMVLVPGTAAEATLKRALERAIDVGIVIAPRVWPAGILSESRGQMPGELHAPLQHHSHWGSYASVHAETADAITAAIVRAGWPFAPAMHIDGATAVLLLGSGLPTSSLADVSRTQPDAAATFATTSNPAG